MQNKTNEPIIVLGFGRSGTTWLSDIISKALGGLILFEPFHPEVFEDAKACCYATGNETIYKKTEHQINTTLRGENKNKWLIRNHLSSKLDDVSEAFTENVWDNSPIIGYKAIRQNFMIPWLLANVSEKIIFIQRDLLSVVSSVIRRERFWEEFGFDFHEQKFFTEVIDSNHYDFLDTHLLKTSYSSLKTDYLKMAFLWIITHQVVDRVSADGKICRVAYQDLYNKPYQTTHQVLSFLGFEEITLHPSYIFTPSMLTLRTFHKESTGATISPEVFYNDVLTKSMIEEIESLEKYLNSIVRK